MFFFNEDASEGEKDLFFMKEALKQAKIAFEHKEVPVGAVLVFQDQVIAKGHNQVEQLKDATAHAEILCITSGCSFMDNWRLSGTTLYTTVEPCCMCAGAIFSSRISRVVFGTKDLRLGACGSFVDLFSQKHPFHEVLIQGGVLQEASALLLKDFFQKRRKD